MCYGALEIPLVVISTNIRQKSMAIDKARRKNHEERGK